MEEISQQEDKGTIREGLRIGDPLVYTFRKSHKSTKLKGTTHMQRTRPVLAARVFVCLHELFSVVLQDLVLLSSLSFCLPNSYILLCWGSLSSEGRGLMGTTPVAIVVSLSVSNIYCKQSSRCHFYYLTRLEKSKKYLLLGLTQFSSYIMHIKNETCTNPLISKQINCG